MKHLMFLLCGLLLLTANYSIGCSTGTAPPGTEEVVKHQFDGFNFEDAVLNPSITQDFEIVDVEINNIDPLKSTVDFRSNEAFNKNCITHVDLHYDPGLYLLNSHFIYNNKINFSNLVTKDWFYLYLSNFRHRC